MGERMRGIKFRAWDEEKNRMYTGDEIEEYDGLNAWLSYGGLAIYRIEDGEYTELKPLQFTGLHDKNGKEIFEGDLINLYCDCDPGDYAFCTHPPTVHKVVWNEEEAGYDLVQISKGKVFEDFSSYMEESWEVIGNIYENPELLENEHE